MNVLYLLLGSILLVVAILDLVWTTLWVDGGSGPLSSQLTTWVWHGLRRLGTERSRILSLSGPLVLVVTLTSWIGILWAGWTLLFAGGESALVATSTQGRVTWAGRIYFVGYAMFTMGNGDFAPSSGVWQIATALTTASGMLFVTLSVSYVLSVLGSVSAKRSFAASVTGLGDSAEAFVEAGWNGESEDFRDLDLPLDTLQSELDTLAEQHQSYPILHYYHSEASDHSSALAVAILDESLTALRYGVPPEHRPNAAIVRGSRASVENYLGTLDSAFIQPADRAPPPPDLGSLREAGIPTVSEGEFEAALEDVDERRRKLRAMVTADAWGWPPPDE